MGRTACTERQCLYKGALYLAFYYYWDYLTIPHLFLNMTLGLRGLCLLKEVAT